MTSQASTYTVQFHTKQGGYYVYTYPSRASAEAYYTAVYVDNNYTWLELVSPTGEVLRNAPR